MKVIWTLMNSASGKLAGVVAANNRGGNYLRSRVIPSNPRGTQQSRIRAILASLASAWRSTLTTVQRDAWQLLGDDQNTGENRFIAANSILLQGGGTRQPVAPASASGTFTPFVFGAGAAAAGQITINDDGELKFFPANATDDWNAAAGGVINLYATQGQSPSRYAKEFPYSWKGSRVRAGAALAAVQTIPSGLTLIAGQIVYVRVTSASASGKLCPDQEIRLIVEAT